MEFIDIFKEKYEQLTEEDVDSALTYCKESLEITSNADIYVYIGDCLMANEDFEGANEAINEGLHKNCTNKTFAYSLKGEALFYMENYEESRLAFNEVINCELNNFFATAYLVDIDIAESMYVDGINRLDKILNSETLSNEDFAFMQTKKGWIMFKYLKKQEEVFKLFEEALDKDIDCGTAYVGLGSYYLYKENYDKSIENYEKAIELGEDCEIVYNGLTVANEKRID